MVLRAVPAVVLLPGSGFFFRCMRGRGRWRGLAGDGGGGRWRRGKRGGGGPAGGQRAWGIAMRVQGWGWRMRFSTVWRTTPAVVPPIRIRSPPQRRGRTGRCRLVFFFPRGRGEGDGRGRRRGKRGSHQRGKRRHDQRPGFFVFWAASWWWWSSSLRSEDIGGVRKGHWWRRGSVFLPFDPLSFQMFPRLLSTPFL